MCRGCGACHRLKLAKKNSIVRCGRDVAPRRHLEISTVVTRKRSSAVVPRQGSSKYCCLRVRAAFGVLNTLVRPPPPVRSHYRQQMFLSLWSRHKSRRCSFLNVFLFLGSFCHRNADLYEAECFIWPRFGFR